MLIQGDVQVLCPLNCMTSQVVTHTHCCLKCRILLLWAHHTLGQGGGRRMVSCCWNNKQSSHGKQGAFTSVLACSMTIKFLPRVDALSGWHAPGASAELAHDSVWPGSAHHPAEQASGQQLPGPRHTCPFPLWHLQQYTVAAVQTVPLTWLWLRSFALQGSSQCMVYCCNNQEVLNEKFS